MGFTGLRLTPITGFEAPVSGKGSRSRGSTTVEVDSPDSSAPFESDKPRISANAVVASGVRCGAVGITISVPAVVESRTTPVGNPLGSMGIGPIRNRRRDCIRVTKCEATRAGVPMGDNSRSLNTMQVALKFSPELPRAAQRLRGNLCRAR